MSNPGISSQEQGSALGARRGCVQRRSSKEREGEDSRSAHGIADGLVHQKLNVGNSVSTARQHPPQEIVSSNSRHGPAETIFCKVLDRICSLEASHQAGLHEVDSTMQELAKQMLNTAIDDSGATGSNGPPLALPHVPGEDTLNVARQEFVTLKEELIAALSSANDLDVRNQELMNRLARLSRDKVQLENDVNTANINAARARTRAQRAELSCLQTAAEYHSVTRRYTHVADNLRSELHKAKRNRHIIEDRVLFYKTQWGVAESKLIEREAHFACLELELNTHIELYKHDLELREVALSKIKEIVRTKVSSDGVISRIRAVLAELAPQEAGDTIHELAGVNKENLADGQVVHLSDSDSVNRRPLAGASANRTHDSGKREKRVRVRSMLDLGKSGPAVTRCRRSSVPALDLCTGGTGFPSLKSCHFNTSNSLSQIPTSCSDGVSFLGVSA